MQSISVEPTNYTPRINFLLNGKLLLEGRSLPENVFSMYDPLIQFAKNIKVHKIELDINLEYFNTASSKKLLELLQTLDTNIKIEYVVVNWHVEADDEDYKEIGEIISECLVRSQMNILTHLELKTLYLEKQHK